MYGCGTALIGGGGGGGGSFRGTDAAAEASKPKMTSIDIDIDIGGRPRIGDNRDEGIRVGQPSGGTRAPTRLALLSLLRPLGDLLLVNTVPVQVGAITDSRKCNDFLR